MLEFLTTLAAKNFFPVANLNFPSLSAPITPCAITTVPVEEFLSGFLVSSFRYWKVVIRPPRNLLFSWLDGHNFLSTCHPRPVIPHPRGSLTARSFHTRNTDPEYGLPPAALTPWPLPPGGAWRRSHRPGPHSGQRSACPLTSPLLRLRGLPRERPDPALLLIALVRRRRVPAARHRLRLLSLALALVLVLGGRHGAGVTVPRRAGRSGSDVGAAEQKAGIGHGSNGRERAAGESRVGPGARGDRGVPTPRGWEGLGAAGLLCREGGGFPAGKGRCSSLAYERGCPASRPPAAIVVQGFVLGARELPVSPLLRCYLYPAYVLLPMVPSCLSLAVSSPLPSRLPAFGRFVLGRLTCFAFLMSISI